jgi:hypothetical protein
MNCGMHAHHFQGAEQLREDLRHLGIL